MHEEKDLGVLINDNLSWNNHVYVIAAKGTRCLGCLNEHVPLLTDTTVRRTLYLALVKSQLSYATEVWSPSTIKMRSKVESVQRRATSWIMQAKRGEMSYEHRLITLNLLPLCYYMVISILMCTGLSHSPTMAQYDSNPSLTLKVQLCKSKIF